MAQFSHTEDLDWHPVRPELAGGVFGKLLQDGMPRVVLTRVAPGGRFAPHRDGYGHLFLILEGEARVLAGTEERTLAAGAVVRIDPGEEHGYANPGHADLLLLSVNLPAPSATPSP